MLHMFSAWEDHASSMHDKGFTDHSLSHKQLSVLHKGTGRILLPMIMMVSTWMLRMVKLLNYQFSFLRDF